MERSPKSFLGIGFLRTIFHDVIVQIASVQIALFRSPTFKLYGVVWFGANSNHSSFSGWFVRSHDWENGSAFDKSNGAVHARRALSDFVPDNSATVYQFVHRCWTKMSFSLCQDLANDVSMHVRQPKTPTLKTIRESFVINAQ